jgi:hypothetical protein
VYVEPIGAFGQVAAPVYTVGSTIIRYSKFVIVPVGVAKVTSAYGYVAHVIVGSGGLIIAPGAAFAVGESKSSEAKKLIKTIETIL